MRKTRDILITLAAAVALTSAALATDFQNLRNNSRVHSELLYASMAYIIDEQCSSLSIRRLKLTGRALSLRSYAKGLGYSGGEVDAYVNSKTEQARFRKIAMDMLASKGAVNGNKASYCDVGRAEIAAGSYTGNILKGG